MAGIKAPIVDIINKLKTLQLPNNAGNSPGLYSAVWNEQLQRLEEGESYPFNLPAAFVELLMSNNYQQLGSGITASDLTFRIHLAMEQIDAGDGDLDQNLTIFEYRDAIVDLLTHFEPTACSMLMHVNNEQDYGHNNVYVYLIDFTCHFIDDKGSRYPTNESADDTDLVVNAGYNPVEILGVTYSGTALAIKYRVAALSQQIKFTITVAGEVSAGSKGPGDYTFTQTVTIPTGEQTLTAKAVTDNYTTNPYKFTV